MMNISEQEYNELKSHSHMLGVIGMHVESFCDEHDTTEIGVLKLLAEYHTIKADEMYARIEKLSNEA